jgi:electron transport complex protein RnfD
MNPTEIKLLLTTSPFLKQQEDTPYIMRQVIYALAPAGLAGVYYFGFASLAVFAVSIGGAVGAEWLFTRGSARNTLHAGSTVLTGFLLALILPPGIPLWMAFLGSVVAIVVGKIVFGGIGSNIFNPALVGRAFLQASFPVAITTWMPQSNLSAFVQLRGHTLTLPFLKSQTAAVTSATPLAQMKFEAKLTAYSDLFLGNISGSLGETSALLLLAGGAYLAIRNFLNWRIPASIFLSVFFFAAFLHWIDPQSYAPPLFHLLSGGLMLGAIYMATDPVSSPVTQRGCWVFGAGIGILVIIIRNFGGLPEGVMYAILLMNAATPLINRVTRARIYGVVKGKK